jgi:putative tryptophan/tyrosine transport system substrate-binding protein
MNRREFVTVLGGAAAAWPLQARAQQGERVRRIGVLVGMAESDPEMQLWLASFRQGLEQLGWLEGRNVRIEYRSYIAGSDELQIRAKELLALQPDVILAEGTSTTAEFQRQTRAIPYRVRRRLRPNWLRLYREPGASRRQSYRSFAIRGEHHW